MVQPELVKSLVKEDLWLLYEKGLLGQCKPKDLMKLCLSKFLFLFWKGEGVIISTTA
jgi:hypothetical protein